MGGRARNDARWGAMRLGHVRYTLGSGGAAGAVGLQTGWTWRGAGLARWGSIGGCVRWVFPMAREERRRIVVSHILENFRTTTRLSRFGESRMLRINAMPRCLGPSQPNTNARCTAMWDDDSLLWFFFLRDKIRLSYLISSSSSLLLRRRRREEKIV